MAKKIPLKDLASMRRAQAHDAINEAVKTAIALEREECAEICDSKGPDATGWQLACMIRNRGK